MQTQLDTRKAIISWSLYDWANSAFATTIMAGFFPIFFKEYWSAGADPVISTARLGFANSLASITVALMAPVLGAIADQGSVKKKFLSFFALIGVVMTCSLYLVQQGNWQMAIFTYVMATIGFTGGNVFYDSLITGVASPNRMHRVSALGFSLGYLGGGLLFAFNVATTLYPHTFGFASQTEAVKFSFLSVGIWWAVFSMPLLLLVREPKGGTMKPGLAFVKEGFKQFIDTFHEIRKIKSVFLFLAAYWLYIDGVDTIVTMAVNYGQSIGFKATDLITALLMVQFIGFPAAIGFGLLGDRIGAQKAIFIAIGVYLFISIWGAFMTNKNEFYILAGVIGLVQGGIQALSRSFYARIIPADKSAEFFGFYNMLGKFASVIGPILIGLSGITARYWGYSSDTASRISISSVSILFIAGALLFYFVDEEKARADVQAAYGNKEKERL
ncbi:MFS transporter [Sphingobacteriales bacterium UPWRP_1]|nr:MFS transporter [Sphingobacteriales bacterium TSM_CSS]PSJ77692.1 MFS transporter [Sphingobacteriales bacterium UPWRP_1]